MNKTVQRLKNSGAQGIIPLCLSTVLLVALISAPVFAQSNDTQNRIKRLENEIDTLSRAVYKGEKQNVYPAVNGGGASSDVDARLSQMENDLRNLTGKVEQQSYDNQQLQQKLDALTQDSRLRLDSLEAQLRQTPARTLADSPPLTMDPAPQAAEENVQSVLEPAQVTGNETGTGAVGDAASLYEQGFGEIKREDYDAAEKSFDKFMKDYPDHALAPNALYWLGETYYVRKDYDKASRVFAQAYQKFPGGPKGADNLLKLGMSLAGKGEKDSACVALAQLKKEYPKGPDPVLRNGEEEMATLGCKS